MNKRQIIVSLNNIANSLDNSGLFKEANALSSVMKKMAQQVPQTQQPNQIPQTGQQQLQQQQPQQQAYGQQNSQQINPQQKNLLLDESERLRNELAHYREKFMSLFEETKRKIHSGIPMQEKNGVLNASIMMNQMIAYLQPLANKQKNIDIQLGYPPQYNENRQQLLNTMRQYSSTINTYYISKKRTQPAQQPVQP
jgi:hypothetical protein